MRKGNFIKFTSFSCMLISWLLCSVSGINASGTIEPVTFRPVPGVGSSDSLASVQAGCWIGNSGMC